MRVDHNFFVTRTFSLRSSFLWQMQTNVSYVGAYGLLSDCNVFKDPTSGKLLDIPGPGVPPTDA